MSNPEIIRRTAESERINRAECFNVAVSIDCVVFGYEMKELKVLLIKSDMKEFSGLWSLLGDLVQPEEDLETASYRILKERTGLDDLHLEQVYTFGTLNRHPSGRVISVAYYTLVDIRQHQPKITSDELHWHRILDMEELAFDHRAILNKCLEHVKRQIENKPIAFKSLPEKFSFRQLQDFYEVILGVQLDRRNFRKKIILKKWLEDINEVEKGVLRRPGKLYKVRDDIYT